MDSSPGITALLIAVTILVLGLSVFALWRDTKSKARQEEAKNQHGSNNSQSSARGIGVKRWFGVIPDGYTGVPLLLKRTTRFFGSGEVKRIVREGKKAQEVYVKVKVKGLKRKPLSALTDQERIILFRKPADGVYIRMPFTKVVPVRTQEEAILISDPRDRSRSRTPVAELTDSDRQGFRVGYNLFWRVSRQNTGLAFKQQMDIVDAGNDEALLARVRQTVASRGEKIVARLNDRQPDDVAANIDQIFEDELEPLLKDDLANIGVELLDLSRASLRWSDRGEDNMMQPARARRDVEANRIVGRGRTAVRDANRPVALDDVIPGWRDLFELVGDADDRDIEQAARECFKMLGEGERREVVYLLDTAFGQESMKQLGSE